MSIDLKKKYRTRNGRPVRLISDQGRQPYPFLGYVGDDFVPCAWSEEGRRMSYELRPSRLHDHDLIEAPGTLTGDLWLVFAVEGKGITNRGEILSCQHSEEAVREAMRYFITGGIRCGAQRVTLNVTEGEVTE